MRWLILTTVVLSIGCAGPGGNPERAEGPPKIVATTTIVADLVRVIGGDDVEVISLMGPGVDPHLYKPSAGDVRRMASADGVFFNGLHLEGKMGEVLGELGGRGIETLAVASCIPDENLITTSQGSSTHDPHVWFDVGLWAHTIDCVRDRLARLAPEHQKDFEMRAAAYREELLALDAEVRDALAEIPGEFRALVTAHDAFVYFGRAYDIEVRGLLGVSTASEAGAADFQELAEFIADRGIPAVFVETSVSPRAIQALREAVAARGTTVEEGGSLYSDALGDPEGPAGTYTGMVRSNVATIVIALSAGGTP